MVKTIAFVAAAAAGLATASAANPYPTVTAHGMGDSCFNEGMQQITALIGKATGSYAKCIPTGNALTDTTNGFLVNALRETQIARWRGVCEGRASSATPRRAGCGNARPGSTQQSREVSRGGSMSARLLLLG
jgi:hypothetical protein